MPRLPFWRSSPSAAKKRIRAIAAAAADKLLIAFNALDAPPREAMPQIVCPLTDNAEAHAREGESTEFHATDQLLGEIDSIRRIWDWARRAEELARSRISENESASKLSALCGLEPWEVDPIDAALDGILEIWTDMLGHEVRTAVDIAGTSYDPMIEFCLACLKAVGLAKTVPGKKLGSDAIRSRIRRISTRVSGVKGPQLAALFGALRGLPAKPKTWWRMG